MAPTPLTPITTPRGACCPAIRVVQVADQEGGWRNGRGGRTVPRGRGRAGGHGRGGAGASGAFGFALCISLTSRCPAGVRRSVGLCDDPTVCPVRDAAGPGGQPGAGRGQRDWPWPAWSPAGPGAACSRSGRWLRAGTGARSLSWGSRGAGWGGRTPEPRSRRVFPGLEGRLGLTSAPGDATRPPASWNRGQGHAALGAVKSGRVW